MIEQTDDKDLLKEKRKQRRKMLLSWLTIIFVIILLVYFLYWLIIGRFRLSTDDAYVNGNIISLMPQIPGTVTKIFADDTHFVPQGSPIIILEKADMEIALQQAHANLANAVREVRQYFENADQAAAEVGLRKAELQKAQLDLKRRVGLIGERAISQEELQHNKTNLQTASAAFNAANYRYRAAIGLIENTSIYNHPIVERAKAEFKRAYLNFQRTTIVAPATGFVAKRNVNVGQQVDLRAPMLAIIPLSQIWVDANYKESQIANIRIGQPVLLTVDAYPGITYHGKVEGLSMGTGAAFAILPPQNATGNWIKIVQRLPVRIQLDPNEVMKSPLKLGLSMRVTINVHDVSGARLSTAVNKKPLFTTDVFENQLKDVDNIINNILTTNSSNLYFKSEQNERA